MRGWTRTGTGTRGARAPREGPTPPHGGARRTAQTRARDAKGGTRHGPQLLRQNVKSKARQFYSAVIECRVCIARPVERVGRYRVGVRATVLPTPPPLATTPDVRPPSLSAVARTCGDTGRHPAPPPPPRVPHGAFWGLLRKSENAGRFSFIRGQGQGLVALLIESLFKILPQISLRSFTNG